jgi:hypothetical protein
MLQITYQTRALEYSQTRDFDTVKRPTSIP